MTGIKFPKVGAPSAPAPASETEEPSSANSHPDIRYYDEVIRLNPDDAPAYNNRGNTYLLQRNSNLGCYDAQETCATGLYIVLEWAKGKGLFHLFIKVTLNRLLL